MKVTHLLLEIIKKKVYFALYLASTSSCGSHSGEWRLATSWSWVQFPGNALIKKNK